MLSVLNPQNGTRSEICSYMLNDFKLTHTSKICKQLLHNKTNYEFNDICNLFSYLSIKCYNIIFYLKHQAKEQFRITLEG